jgi:DNA-binding LacI/PurR family transcriptional regulator/glycogen debranching enzyme
MPKSPRKARIQDVARLAGVSPTTVSYVLNGRGNIPPATRERVLEAAERLGYAANGPGRALATQRSHVLALSAPRATEPGDPFFAAIATAFTHTAARAGYQVALLPPDTEVPDIARAVRSQRFDGVVLLELQPEDTRVQTLNDSGVPFVLFGRSHLPVGWLDVDNYRGGWMATHHLLELDHRHIAHIAAPQQYLYARLRRQGYQDALAAADPNLVPLIEEGDLSLDSGYALARKLLLANPRPTAIFAASDVMAVGVLRAAADLGLRVPENLSVVGFDDAPLAAQFKPALTTVSQRADELGAKLATRLIQEIEGTSMRPELVLPELIVRKTTGPVPRLKLRLRGAEPLTIKAGPSFMLWSARGMVEPRTGNQGLYAGDTHRLNGYRVAINGVTPDPVQVTKQSDSFQMEYVLPLGDGTLSVIREVMLGPQSLDDTWRWNRWGGNHPWSLTLDLSADFRDIFEMRGFEVESRGIRRSELREDGSERHQYTGRDGVIRMLGVTMEPAPTENELGQKRWDIQGTTREGVLRIHMSWDLPAPLVPRHAGTQEADWPRVTVDNADWQTVLDRAREDLTMLATDFGHGPVLSAGLPWYGTLFGRDALLSAYQTLWARPDWSEATLATLAQYQGQVMDPVRAEVPGKIVHEVRFGELANLGEVPFGRYYGSVDVTPLYLTLLRATWRRTGDWGLVHRHWGVAEAALEWLRCALRTSPDGLVRFNADEGAGLTVQSWKDSADSMVYDDGRRAHPPLAVAEVQGYVFQALLAMAEIYRAMHRDDEAETLTREAMALHRRFHECFWSPRLSYYAMAIDGHGQRLDVLSSDPGQCLWTGIIPEAYRGHVVKRLTGPDLWSGWGIRTLGAQERTYDPFSYHRGSIWPHDTSLAVAGMAQAGFDDEAYRTAAGLIDAAMGLPDQRLPELFAGVGRGPTRDRPLPYPLACAPQAWAAGAPWLLLQSLLGLEIDAVNRVLRVRRAPRSLGRVTIRSLRVKEGQIGIVVDAENVSVEDLPPGWRVDRVGSSHGAVQTSHLTESEA